MASPASSSSSSGVSVDVSGLPEKWRPSSSEYTLYYNPFSQPSRAVAQTFEEGKIPYKAITIDLNKKEQKLPEYTSIINPQGLIPVIYNPQEKKFQNESAEIMKYLVKTYPKTLASWYPIDDAKTTAYIDEQLKWIGSDVRQISTEYLRAVSVYKNPQKAKEKKEQVPAMLEDIENHLKQAVDKYNSSADNKDKTAIPSIIYVAGTSHPTIADLQLIHELNMPYNIGIITIDASKNPLLNKWYHNMAERPLAKKVYAPTAFLVGLGSVVLKVKGWFGGTTL